MKKLLLSIAALALIAFASFQAYAWFNVGMVGGGVPAGGASFATPAFVQLKAEYASDGVLAFDSSVGAGSLIVVFVSGQDDGTTVEPSVADNRGNSYTVLGSLSSADAGTISYCAMAYAINTTAQTVTVTITFGGNTTDNGFVIAEYSGIDTSDPLIDTATGNNATASTSVSSAAMTSDQTHILIVSGFANETMFDGFTEGANFTERDDNTSHAHFLQDRVLTTASGDYSAPATQGSSSNAWCTYAAMFRAAGL